MRRAILFVSILAVFPGCSAKPRAAVYRIPESHFSALTVGMHRGQVERTLGVSPRHVGGKEFATKTVEVFRFSIPPEDDPEVPAPQKEYFLYFVDDRLAGWGEPGDWEREAAMILRSPPR